MTTIRTVDVSARDRIRSHHSDTRAPYREAIAALANDRALELTPADGESLRKLKVNVSRAAKEVGREIKYGETDEGTLVVWPASIRRRTRRVRSA
jgi:hypothetical protein